MHRGQEGTWAHALQPLEFSIGKAKIITILKVCKSNALRPQHIFHGMLLMCPLPEFIFLLLVCPPSSESHRTLMQCSYGPLYRLKNTYTLTIQSRAVVRAKFSNIVYVRVFNKILSYMYFRILKIIVYYRIFSSIRICFKFNK